MKRFVIGFVVAALLCGCGLRSESKQEKKAQGSQPQQAQQTNVSQDLLVTAIGFIQDGNFLEGIKTLDQSIMEDPENLQAYLLLGQTYMHMNEFDRSVDSYRAALHIAPDQGEIYYMLALVNGLRGRKDLAVTNAEKALLLFQKDRDGQNFKRALILLQGLSDEG